jgi:hypothetical protein
MGTPNEEIWICNTRQLTFGSQIIITNTSKNIVVYRKKFRVMKSYIQT